MAQSKAETVEEYLAELSPERRSEIATVRKVGHVPSSGVRVRHRVAVV